MPWDGDSAVVLSAYLDASKRDYGNGGGVLSVAAISYGADRAKKVTKEWIKLWGEKRCHMTDLHTRKKGGEFADWTSEQAGQYLKKSVQIINRNASHAVAVSCDIEELQRLAPKPSDLKPKVLAGGLSHQYGFCCHLAMGALARLVQGDDGIAYFFESGDDFQTESQNFLRWFVSHPEITMYKRRSHTVLRKVDCRLFETTDIVAWEWAKHIERQGEGKGMRGSLRALLGDDIRMDIPTNVMSPTRRCWHVTGEPMENYFKQAEALGILR